MRLHRLDLAAFGPFRDGQEIDFDALTRSGLFLLTGDTGRYDPEAYRTGQYRSGHFDREAVHHQDGEAFPFAPGSFRRFRREPAAGPFLRRLYFVTRPGPVWGVSAAALARIGFRVATDERWDPDSDAYLRGLLRWCRSLADAVAAADDRLPGTVCEMTGEFSGACLKVDRGNVALRCEDATGTKVFCCRKNADGSPLPPPDAPCFADSQDAGTLVAP